MRLTALQQTLPVRVLVADQGASDKTAAVMERYAGHPCVEHIVTKGKADCLWSNWRLAAEACRTDLIAWLQDDDILTRVYASRVVQAFDRYPQALHWEARCYCSPDRVHALWWSGNGPSWGLDTINMQPEALPGSILLGSMYFVAWSLSPGVAFRNCEEFRLAIAAMPTNADLFAERLILAAMAAQGPFIIDPIVAGYWVHHGGNESYIQNINGSAADQRLIMIGGMDEILDHSPGWREGFAIWCSSRSPFEILGWLKDFPAIESRHANELRKILGDSLNGRIEPVPADQVPATMARTATPDPVIIYEDAAA